MVSQCPTRAFRAPLICRWNSRRYSGPLPETSTDAGWIGYCFASGGRGSNIRQNAIHDIGVGPGRERAPDREGREDRPTRKPGGFRNWPPLSLNRSSRCTPKPAATLVCGTALGYG